MPQQDIKPRFEVEAVAGVVTVTKYRRDAEKGINEEYTVEEPYGFNVYFPSGNSIRVATRDELKRLGFDQAPGLIDMETGDEVSNGIPSLKQQVQRRAGASRSRADTTSVDANQGD